MAEACPDNRRCLPAWMMKPCSSNEHRNKKAVESDKLSGALDETKPIRRKRKIVDTEDAGGLKALQRCQDKEKSRRKGKDVDRAVTDECDEIEKITCKNERKVSGRAAPKNSRKQKLDNVGSEALSSGTADDEIELTVEDLVSIAEEIVNADKGKLQSVRTTKTARYEEHPPRPPVSTSADTGGSASSTWSTKGLTQCTATTTDGTPSEYSIEKNSRHEEPECLSSIKMTGDVAEDMMNLLLGPLWNSEPAAHENKPEAVAPRTMNVNLAPRRKTDWQKTVAQVQGVPVAKKKSSLKDMVAFFLD